MADKEEISAVTSILQSRTLTSAANHGGKHVQLFEKQASSFTKSKYAVAVNSGTAALQAALLALDLKKGDEVLLPSFTFVATANAVYSVGAKPVFARIFGLNLRLPEISAAIATIQIKRLSKFLKARKSNATYLSKLISDLKVDLPKSKRCENVNWYLYTIATSKRGKLLKALNEKGIGAAVYYTTPVHKTPFYKSKIGLPVTDWAASSVLSLPIHPKVTKKNLDVIAKIMHEVL